MALAPAVRAPLLRLVRDLDRWRAGTVDWSGTVHAILLSGPPGNGKMMLATALAGSLDVPLIATSYAQCQAAGHLGQYLAAMRATVDRAIAQAPAVFFLDECDSFLRRDTEHHNAAYGRQVVNDMLEQLTRLHATPGVVVLAATNAPEQVDPALRRAGRFDLALELGPPDRAGLQAILQAGLGAASPGPDVVADIARALVGQSGAVAAAVAREALATARDAGVPVGPAHLATAISRHAPPLPRDLAWRVAVHEDGHVLVAAARGVALPERVTIGAQGGAALMAPPPVMTADSTLDWVAMLMGGRAAERAVFGAASSGAGAGPGSNLDRATALLLEMELSWGLGDCGLVHAPIPPDRRAWLPEGPRRKIDALLIEAEAEALAHLRADMARLIALARRLDETRHLDRTDIAALLEDHASAPPPPDMDGATIIPQR